MPVTVDYNSLLANIDSFIKRNRGTHFEADVFAHLLVCPFVLRSFEFALADGALYATINEEPPSGNYTERFWQLHEQVRMFRNSIQHWRRILVLFDAKSCTSNCAEDQVYITTLKQKAKVGFYIAICAANPSYVEVFPNRFNMISYIEDDRRKVSVNLSRQSFLQPSAYGSLSPCNSLYRMPIALLPEALASIRRCAQDLGDFVNPWTGVHFPGWKPLIVHDDECLAPSEESQQYSSFKGVMEIWRAVRIANLDMVFELVSLQPRLADFKLLVPDIQAAAYTTNSPSNMLKLLSRRQLFVQYKIDALYRSPRTPLTKVSIARNDRKGSLRCYFTENERYVPVHSVELFAKVFSFDYLFYQFDYQDQRSSWTHFFFLPECKIPDEFYVTEAREADFDRAEFKPYWLYMGPSNDWVRQVYNIIQETPQPRKSGKRPRRPFQNPPDLPTQALSQDDHLSTNYVKSFHRKFFHTMMAQCAARLSGLIVILSRSNPIADFLYCRYKWTSEQQQAFLVEQVVPCTIAQLPQSTPAVPIILYAKNREGTSRGPSLTATEFQRLDTSSHNRLLLFDLFGVEGSDIYSPVLVVPSDDLSPTSEQRVLYESNKRRNKDEQFEGRVPLLAELLYTRLIPVDYAVCTKGPLLFEPETDPWGEVWQLLDQFLGLDDLIYPRAHSHNPNCYRESSNYRVSVQEVHQALADRHAFVETQPSFLRY